MFKFHRAAQQISPDVRGAHALPAALTVQEFQRWFFLFFCVFNEKI